jgi:uncharacterized protein YegP (UPF0339 family)
MAGKFELISKKDKFRFNLKAGNGQVILSSETYNTKASARNGIESVKKNSKGDDRFERRAAKDGSPYFVLLAKNNEIIGKSQMYASKSNMENGIDSVQKNAGGAPTVEIEE